MSVVLIIVIVVAAIVLLLTLVGAAGASRRNRAGAERFSASLASVDQQLAHAVAEDRGWERATLEAIARRELLARQPDERIETLELIQLVDEPGTDNDVAVFRARHARGTSRITLARRGGDWHAASVDDE